jgi:putative ABC transport system permease protein
LVSIALTTVFVEVGRFDPLVVAVAAAVLAAASIAASAIPARRASRVEPVLALRSD